MKKPSKKIKKKGTSAIEKSDKKKILQLKKSAKIKFHGIYDLYNTYTYIHSYKHIQRECVCIGGERKTGGRERDTNDKE